LKKQSKTSYTKNDGAIKVKKIEVPMRMIDENKVSHLPDPIATQVSDLGQISAPISAQISVTADPIYLEEESSPTRHQFVWAYHVTIKNTSTETVTLRRRHWRITESRGVEQEITGDGVIGQEPILQPGESFIYTSGALLSSPSGIMEGNYEMEGATGQMFQVRIPPFSLDSPHEKSLVH
jgi:ApaG protein